MTSRAMECHRGVGEFTERRRIRLFRPKRKSASKNEVRIAF